jgi:hypothetical protein
MLHKEFWGLLFLAFVGWIFISSSPTERIEHLCRPVHWSGNIATSFSALIVPSQQSNVQKWFDKFEYGCQYMTWRLLYQADYNKAIGVDPNNKPLEDGDIPPAKVPAGKSQAAPAPAPAAPAAPASAPAVTEPVAK